MLYLVDVKFISNKNLKHLFMVDYLMWTRSKLIPYLQLMIEVNPMSISIHISIFYLRPFIVINRDVDT
jgi:hypothetical protein